MANRQSDNVKRTGQQNERLKYEQIDLLNKVKHSLAINPAN